MKINRSVSIFLLSAGFLFQSCSGLKPSSDGRMGLFDDLARNGDGQASQGLTSHGEVKTKSDARQEKATLVAQTSEKRLKNAKLEWPLKHVQVTSTFGKRARDFHEGVDLKARSGTPIYASQSGTVIYAGAKIRGYGKMIILKHTGGVATVYAHASKLLVRRGQKVNLGDKIAMSGKTGKVTGPHLHFEVRSGSVAVNPIEFLPHKQMARLKTLPKREIASAHD